MDLKKQSFQKRLAAGNKVAELIRKYLVNRFGEDISDLSGTTGDIKDGIDFGIFQCKVRFSKYGNDIIFEAVKFIPKSVGNIVVKGDVIVADSIDVEGIQGQNEH